MALQAFFYWDAWLSTDHSGDRADTVGGSSLDTALKVKK